MNDDTTMETEQDVPDDLMDVGDRMPADAENLIPLLASEEQRNWVTKRLSKLKREFDEDWDGRDEHMQRCANHRKLYAGDIEPMKYPAEGAKKPFLPVMTRPVLKLAAHILDQVCPSNGDVVSAVATDTTDEARQDRVRIFLNWEKRKKDPNYRTSLYNTIVAVLLDGSTFRYQGRDPFEDKNLDEDLSIEDLVLPYTEKSKDLHLRDVSHYSIVWRYSRQQLEDMAETGFYVNVEKLWPEDEKDDESAGGRESAAGEFGDSELKESPVRQAADQIQGVEKPKGRSDVRKIISYHGWLRLPKEINQSGKLRPVIFDYDAESKTALRLVLREEEDPFDRMRFERETAEVTAKAKALTSAFEQAVAMGQQTEPPQLPPPPKEPRRRPVYPVVHFPLFRNPEGIYQLGIGYLLEGNAELANELAGEFMVSARFANIAQGFAAKGALGKALKGEFQAIPGKIKETELEPEQLQAGIKFIQPPPPNPAMMQLAHEMVMTGDQLTVDTDLLGGAAGGSHETARGIMERTNMALKIVSFISTVIQESLKACFKNTARLHATYLTNEEYFAVVAPDKQVPQGIPEDFARREFVEDFDITLTADLRGTSADEKVQKEIAKFQLILNSPLSQMKPLVLTQARRIFEADHDAELAQMVMQMMQPPPPPSPMSQENEIQGFFNEQDHPVLPDDDHGDHMGKIQQFKASEMAKKLSPTGKQMLDRHERGHMAAIYAAAAAQLNKGVPNAIGPVPPGGQVGAPGVGAGPGQPGALGGFTPVGAEPPTQSQ